MHTLIVLGGKLPAATLLSQLSAGADLRIAADRGLEAFHAAGIVPDLLLGDMDSVQPEILRAFEKMVPERRLPCMKDDTDGQDALKTAIGRGTTDVLILGAMGGRLDHALGNISLLLYAAHRGVRARIADEGVTVEAVRNLLRIEGEKGDTVSLIPMGDISGVSLEGFLYPLQEAELKAENTQGISNVLTAKTGEIRVRSGDAVVFHYHAGRTCEWDRSELSGDGRDLG